MILSHRCNPCQEPSKLVGDTPTPHVNVLGSGEAGDSSRSEGVGFANPLSAPKKLQAPDGWTYVGGGPGRPRSCRN